MAGWASESGNWAPAGSQGEHCIVWQLTSWCPSSIRWLLPPCWNINYAWVGSQSCYIVVPLTPAWSFSFRRESIKDRLAGLSWTFHVQDCFLHSIRKETNLTGSHLLNVKISQLGLQNCSVLEFLSWATDLPGKHLLYWASRILTTQSIS